MPNEHPGSTAQIAGHPIHPMLVPFPIASLVGAWVSDLAYWQTGDAFWPTASFYLLAAGIVTALAAALAGFTDYFGERRIRALAAARLHMLGNLVAVLISVVNFVLRLGDPETSVLPLGLALSTAVGLLLVGTGWLGGELVFRHRVAVAGDDRARS